MILNFSSHPTQEGWPTIGKAWSTKNPDVFQITIGMQEKKEDKWEDILSDVVLHKGDNLYLSEFVSQDNKAPKFILKSPDNKDKEVKEETNLPEFDAKVNENRFYTIGKAWPSKSGKGYRVTIQMQKKEGDKWVNEYGSIKLKAGDRLIMRKVNSQKEKAPVFEISVPPVTKE